VEESFGFVNAKESGDVASWWCEIADVCDNGSDTFSVFVVLLSEAGHSSTAAFCGTWMEVEVDDSEVRVIWVFDFIAHCFFESDRNFGLLFEFDSS